MSAWVRLGAMTASARSKPRLLRSFCQAHALSATCPLTAWNHVVTQEWPHILGLDAVALALFVGDKGMRADASGLQFVDAKIIEKSIRGFDGVLLRGCERGHPLFGPACELNRAEALIRLTSEPPLPSGLLALGQRGPQSFDSRHGSELLIFLGRVLTRCMGRWLIP